MKLGLGELGGRLGGVSLFCGPGLELLEFVSVRFPGAVYYVDPPWEQVSVSSRSLLWGAESRLCAEP